MDKPNFTALAIRVKPLVDAWEDVVWPEMHNLPSIGQCIIGENLKNEPVHGRVSKVLLYGEGRAVVMVNREWDASALNHAMCDIVMGLDTVSYGASKIAEGFEDVGKGARAVMHWITWWVT